MNVYLSVCPLRSPGSIPGSGRVFQGIDHVLPLCPEPANQKNSSISLSMASHNP